MVGHPHSTPRTATTRKALFAGSWYPADPDECENLIRSFLADPKAGTRTGGDAAGPWKAGIVPHAGWVFSGAIAGNVIHELARSGPVDLAVVLGMHLHPSSPPHLMPEGAWWTPFGLLPVAADLADELSQRFSFQRETPTRFVQDNTIELQLPFVKYFLPEAEVLCLGVPPSGLALEIADAMVELIRRDRRRAVVIGSTDLTHYGPNYGFTTHGAGRPALNWVVSENDRRFIDAALALDPETMISEGLTRRNACCSGAAAAAVRAAKGLGAGEGVELSYATSHDRHPSDSFVGYAGLLFR